MKRFKMVITVTLGILIVTTIMFLLTTFITGGTEWMVDHSNEATGVRLFFTFAWILVNGLGAALLWELS